MASRRSWSSNHCRVTWRALCPEGSSPSRSSTRAARGSTGLPCSSSEMPPESTSTDEASPARSSSRSRASSAIGERQMLPVHTTAMRYMRSSVGGMHVRRMSGP